MLPKKREKTKSMGIVDRVMLVFLNYQHRHRVLQSQVL